ncbi:hypothetical protein ES332_A04G085400v1 [Gossypium tomentosum]|uniref:Uncharacterized protein n=1 Tax=Gossypium tomentosum TaxID=34277 RepID=A0A5D2QZV4_GOSTO|nr:hypothetical protein ES332_A04G085400v1 [Gossypium tomentosum]
MILKLDIWEIQCLIIEFKNTSTHHHFGLKQRYLLISVPSLLHRLLIHFLKNTILPSPNFHLTNTQMAAISCFLRLRHSSPSFRVS